MAGKTRSSTTGAKKAATDAVKTWESSMVKERDLKAAKASGFIDDKDEVRVPDDELVPRPPAGFRVMFLPFLYRGLSLPVHEFFRGLLFYYGPQLHNLAPNSILQVACFITLCECYLGINPHWGLWKHLFYPKHHSSNLIRGVGFSRVGGTGYFEMNMAEFIIGWRRKWFYIKDRRTASQTFGLPEFVADALVQGLARWKHTLTEEEEVEVALMLSKIQTLRADSELSGL
jgi:hypothetical protein